MRRRTLALLLLSLSTLAGCKSQKTEAPRAAPASTNAAQSNQNAASSQQRTELGLSLLQAAGKGETNTVKELLEKGADVNFKGSDGRTPLMEATYAGQTETVKLLLNYGADISAKKADGETPTTFAARHKDISELFKKASALVEAASKGDNQAVRSLIDQGTPVNGLDQFGHSALTEASWNGHTETVKLLLEKGGNPNLKKADGASPLDIAKGQKHQDIVELLQQAMAKSVTPTPTPTGTATTHN